MKTNICRSFTSEDESSINISIIMDVYERHWNLTIKVKSFGHLCLVLKYGEECFSTRTLTNFSHILSSLYLFAQIIKNEYILTQYNFCILFGKWVYNCNHIHFCISWWYRATNHLPSKLSTYLNKCTICVMF